MGKPAERREAIEAILRDHFQLARPDNVAYLESQISRIAELILRLDPPAADFDVTLQMVQAGVEKYLAFDADAEEPASLIFDVLYTARDMWKEVRAEGVGAG